MRTIGKLAKLRMSEFAVTRLEKIAVKMGIDENKVLELYVAAKNNIGRERFHKLPYSERIILLPQCLRSRDCPAKLGEYGYECVNCGRCNLGNIIDRAKTLGYKKAMIISGGSIVSNIFFKLKPKACLGIGCFKELVMANFVCEKFGIAGQGVPLLKDGCIETDLDWNVLNGMLHYSNGYVK